MALKTFVAFSGHRCVGSGDLETVIRSVKGHLDKAGVPPEAGTVLFFDDRTGKQVDFDLRGSTRQVLARLAEHPVRAETREVAKPEGPGRPRLGVVSREVSLLPRHWEWLGEQRGGMSVALRGLVEHAMKRGTHAHHARKARDAAGTFMWAIGGNLPNFEEATRALYGKDGATLATLIKRWPKDVRAHVERLVAEAVRLESLATLEAQGLGPMIRD
jgi:hypothetical protein